MVKLPAFALVLMLGGTACFSGILVTQAQTTVEAQAQTTVEAQKILYPGGKPQFDAPRSYPVRTVKQLDLSTASVAKPGSTSPDTQLDLYGGRMDRSASATGFFYTRKIKGRWWMVDPLGHFYLHNAVVDLHPGDSARSKKVLSTAFGSDAEWMRSTHQMLLDNGIHGAGAWTYVDLLRHSPLQAEHPLAYTINLDMMAAYGRHRGGTHSEPGHQGYPQDTIFLFDPEFPAFADQYLRRIDAYRDDPNLVGYFSDNEVPLYRKNLDGYLNLPADDPGHVAAQAWMTENKADRVTDELRTRFLEFEADLYFKIVTAALLKHDPHHMYLGCRYTGQQLTEPALFRAAGRYAAAVSINYYSDWQPSSASMAMWEREAGKPFMITEFYVKAKDSGLANKTGAGWQVRSQADRGLFYQNFVIDLLENGNCVGWHWFKYQDNDPADPKAEASNIDSNKGIVDVDYKPYEPLLAAMRELNAHIYGIADRFSARVAVETGRPGSSPGKTSSSSRNP